MIKKSNKESRLLRLIPSLDAKAQKDRRDKFIKQMHHILKKLQKINEDKVRIDPNNIEDNRRKKREDAPKLYILEQNNGTPFYGAFECEGKLEKKVKPKKTKFVRQVKLFMDELKAGTLTNH